MDPEPEVVTAVREPWVARHGLLAAAVLVAAGVVAPLIGPTAGPTAGAGGGAAAAQDAAPYGVAGCMPAAGAAPVDVLVTARALSAAGDPSTALGAVPGGPEVGASVRDLAGYAAEDVAACDVVQVTVHLHDPDGAGSVSGALRAAGGPSTAVTGTGEGELVALDVATWADSLPDAVPADALEERAAWFVTLVDPVPGTYRLTGRITSGGPGAVTGDVEVLVEVAPAAG